MSPNVKQVLNSILEQFKEEDIPTAVAFSMFPIADIPSTKWSILNRTVMFLAGTQDARGFRQWQEECVFFHEFAHCARDKVRDGLKNGHDPLQGMVAELSAQALCRIVGKSGARYLGNSYHYIKGYAEKIEAFPYSAGLKVISERGKILNLILRGGTRFEIEYAVNRGIPIQVHWENNQNQQHYRYPFEFIP